MRNTILQLLAMTATKYDKMVISHYHDWCALQSIDDSDCQKLLSNPLLFNWWFNQYLQLEAKFINRAAEFHGKADREVMRAFHDEIVAHVRDFYSKPLILQARKQKPITPQLN